MSHNPLKKRKLTEAVPQPKINNQLMEQFLIKDILFLISEYLDSIKDFISLFQITKYVYFTIIRNSEIILQNELFKSDDVTIYLNKKLLPNYLCQLQNLNINYDSQNDLNLLKKFKHLKCLTINCLDEDFVFPFLPFLEELHLSNSNLNKLTLKKLQKQLKTLTLNNCSLIDSYIDYLNNLQEFTLLNCKDITCWQKFVGNCLQNFTNLTKLKEESLDENRDITKYIENLINLKYLDIYECGNTEIKNSNFIKKLTNVHM